MGAAAATGALAVIGGISQAVIHSAKADTPSVQTLARGKLREYWIQADSFYHNLMPTGVEGMMGMHYKADQTSYWAIGYRAYTPGWKAPLPGNDDIGTNTGIPGPVIRGEVGDTIRVHFRNNNTHYGFPHSIHPHGVLYTPLNDGAWTAYFGDKPGTIVKVGENYTYEWTVIPSSVGTWPYHDHSHPAKPHRSFQRHGHWRTWSRAGYVWYVRAD